MSQKTSNALTYYICGAIALAIGVALVVPHFAKGLDVGGEIFLALLKMMVVPLVVLSVMHGILGLGDVRKLGRPGGATVAYYLATTVLAVIVGLVVVNIIQPGVGATVEANVEADERVAEAGEPPSIAEALEKVALMLFTDNLFRSAAEAQLLPLIIFSVLFAGVLSTMGSRVKALTDLIAQANDAMMTFILLLMKLAPLGIFCLVAARFGEAHAEGEFVAELRKTGSYVVTVLVGLAFHAVVTLPLIYWAVTRKNPFRFAYQISQALLTAFSTASSSATLPVTMDCTVHRAGVPKRATEFVLPLGATINMDGTALYEAVAAIFIAQAVGYDLSLTQQLIVAVTATLAAIGAAGIPEAGLFTMMIVLSAVGLPTEYVALILPVDWFLDRFRTAINVFGDSVGAAAVGTVFSDTFDDPQKAST